MKTTKPYINCSTCNKQINYFYDSFASQKICCECLVKEKGGFPKGKGCTVPCKLCKEPEINWIRKETYGKNDKDCGNHDFSILDELFES